MALNYTWLRAGVVVLDVSGLPLFPPLPLGPGLYRFDFGLDDDGRRAVYIGEGKSIAKRAVQYRNANDDRKRALTSRRLRRAVVDHLATGQKIEMSVIVAAHVANGSTITFGQKSGRLLVESAAVVLAQLDTTVCVLNVDHDQVAGLDG